MPGPSTLRRSNAATASVQSGALVDVVVLSADVALFDAIRDAIGERNPVWRARSAEESVDLLITGRCGVLLVDLASVSTQPDTLIQQIVDQFPDVVVCVAGIREDEPLLAPLISDGLVYRFMHKPLSPRRAGMFLQAAIRHHCERDQGVMQEPALHLVNSLPSRFDPWKWLFVTLGVALFVMILAAVLRHREPQPPHPAATAAAAPAARTTSDVRADPVLSRARAAFDAGRYETPPGRNALDLFKAVLLAHPDNAEAQAGLDKTIDRILNDAGRALEAGDSVEAQRLVDRALEADPGRRTAVLLAQRMRKIDREPVATVVLPPVPTSAAASMTPAADPVRVPVAAAASARAPAPAAQRATVAAGATPGTAKVAPTPVIVKPDPLTPRVANAPPAAAAAPRSRVRTFGAPISPGLPTAGDVTATAAEVAPAPAASVEPAPGAFASGAATAPADSLERLVMTEPVYPPQALRNRTTGWVELEFTITPAGGVGEIAVVEAQPRGVFEQAATTALGTWRFRPRIVNGQPVAQRSTVTMHFDFDG